MNDRDRNVLRTLNAEDPAHGHGSYPRDLETLRHCAPLKGIVAGHKLDDSNLTGHTTPVENSMALRATAARDEAPGATEQEDLRIRNKVLKQLMKAGLSGTEWALVLAVIQAACNQNKPVVSISLREFHELVCLNQEAVRKGLQALRKRNILVLETAPSFRRSSGWRLNADCDSWAPSNSRRLPCQHTLPQQHTESPAPAQERVLHEHTLPFSEDTNELPEKIADAVSTELERQPATMIYISNKYNRINKESSSQTDASVEALELAGYFREAVRIRDPRSKAARTENLSAWARDIDLLIRIDQRTPEEIRRVIDWCQQPGGFWGPNILSGRKLREKFDTLAGQMMRQSCGGENGASGGNPKVPKILNNRAERNYTPTKQPVRI